MTTPRHAIAIEPRGLNREEAAAWLGLSPNTFDRMVAAGELPGPARSAVCPRVLRWDRLALGAAFFGDKLAPAGTVAPAASFWDDVA